VTSWSTSDFPFYPAQLLSVYQRYDIILDRSHHVNKKAPPRKWKGHPKQGVQGDQFGSEQDAVETIAY
jgi:hypothetical protein